MAFFSYIGGFDNPLRLHSSQGYRSLVDYESDCCHAQAATVNPQADHAP